MKKKRILSICFLIVLPFVIAAESSFEETIRNRGFTGEPKKSLYDFNAERLKSPYFFSIGLPDAFFKVSGISAGYHWNKFLSFGVSRNLYRQYYHDEGSTDGYDKGKYGIMSYSMKTVWQDFGKIKGSPDLGFNLFLHYYPLADVDIPIYIPLYIGRSIRSQVIWGSENVIVRPGSSSNPVIAMEADYLPTTYIGSGLGIKFSLPKGISLGMEFGYVKMQNPELDFNLRGSYLNASPINIVDIFIYEKIFKNAFPGTSIVKLNYGIIVGISF